MPANGHEIYRTDDEVIQALYKTGGNINATAALLKLGSKPLRERIRRNPELKDVMLEAREQLLDLAENHVARELRKKRPNMETVKWYLTKQGRGRGYGDITTNINANLNANYDLSNIPLEEKRKLLETINGARTDSD